MNLTPTTTPKVVRALFPNLVWDLPVAEEKVIYLSFDDGPTSDITEWTLNILEQYKAKATFFCIGKNIDNHPNIFNKIIEQGHAVGNHTYNHVKGWKTSVADYLKDIQLAQDLIDSKLETCQSKIGNQKSSIVNQKSKIKNLFRPPYGQIKPTQIKKLQHLNYRVVMWTVLSIDWDVAISKEQCLKNVIDNTKSGSIVVFHDSVKAARNMQYSLPKVLNYFSEKGYVFKRIPG